MVPERSGTARVQRDHAAQPAAVLGRDPGRAHAYRLKLAVLERRGERDRPVVVQRHAVDHILCVVFRPARVQYRVGLEQPTRHCGHNVDSAAPHGGAERPVQAFAPKSDRGRRAERIKKRRLRHDGHGLPDRCNLQDHPDRLGHRRPHVNPLLRRRKPRMRRREPVDTRRNPGQNCPSICVRARRRGELRAARIDAHARGKAAAGGVKDYDLDPALHALRQAWRTYVGGKRKNIPKRVQLTGREPTGKMSVVGAKDHDTKQVTAALAAVPRPTQAMPRPTMACRASVRASSNPRASICAAKCRPTAPKSFWPMLKRGYCGISHRMRAKHRHLHTPPSLQAGTMSATRIPCGKWQPWPTHGRKALALCRHCSSSLARLSLRQKRDPAGNRNWIQSTTLTPGKESSRFAPRQPTCLRAIARRGFSSQSWRSWQTQGQSIPLLSGAWHAAGAASSPDARTRPSQPRSCGPLCEALGVQHRPRLNPARRRKTQGAG